MINQETKLPYAKFDHSDTRIRQAQYRHVPSWHGAHIYCLKMRDDEAAELIRSRNTVKRIYCGDRDRGCGAELTSADLENGSCTQCGEPLVGPELPLKHALLLSLSELQSQRDAA